MLYRYPIGNGFGIVVDIQFDTTKLAKIFNAEKALVRQFGQKTATKIMLRMATLAAAPNLAAVPISKPDRCHQLAADRDEQFAVDLDHPRRLVFEVDHDPAPRLEDGGIDTRRVTQIIICEVVDYH